MGPERRSMIMPEWEKKNTAYHEAGHAIIAHLLPGHDPVQKVTIVPRGRALGVTWTLPSEDRLSMTRQAILKKIAMLMGGRAAEEVAMKAVTGGAANDIQQATRLSTICDLDVGRTWPGFIKESNEVFLGLKWPPQSHTAWTAQNIDARSTICHAPTTPRAPSWSPTSTCWKPSHST